MGISRAQRDRLLLLRIEADQCRFPKSCANPPMRKIQSLGNGTLDAATAELSEILESDDGEAAFRVIRAYFEDAAAAFTALATAYRARRKDENPAGRTITLASGGIS